MTYYKIDKIKEFQHFWYWSYIMLLLKLSLKVLFDLAYSIFFLVSIFLFYYFFNEVFKNITKLYIFCWLFFFRNEDYKSYVSWHDSCLADRIKKYCSVNCNKNKRNCDITLACDQTICFIFIILTFGSKSILKSSV